MDPCRGEDHLLLQRGGDPAPRYHGGCDEATRREVEALSEQIAVEFRRCESACAGQRPQGPQFTRPLPHQHSATWLCGHAWCFELLYGRSSISTWVLEKRRARLLSWSASLTLYPNQSFQFDFGPLNLASAAEDPKVDAGARGAGVQVNVARLVGAVGQRVLPCNRSAGVSQRVSHAEAVQRFLINPVHALRRRNSRCFVKGRPDETKIFPLWTVCILQSIFTIRIIFRSCFSSLPFAPYRGFSICLFTLSINRSLSSNSDNIDRSKSYAMLNRVPRPTCSY